MAAKAVVWSLICMAGALTMLLPAVYDLVTYLTGVPNLAQLLSHGFSAGTFISVHTLLSFWRHPPDRAAVEARRMAAVTVVGALVMAALFVVAETAHAQAGTWTYANNGEPLVATYMIIWAAQNSVIYARLAAWGWRLSGQMPSQPAIRLGLRIMTAAGSVGLVYAAELVVVALGGINGEPGPIFLVIHRATRWTLVILWVASLAVPVAGAGAAALRRAVRCYQMRPLWLAVVQAELTGMITLDPPRSRLADLFGLATSKQEVMLFRRIVEVRDGYLALRRWFDPNATATATWYAKELGLTGVSLSVAVEAATVAWALEARNEARQFGEGPPSYGGAESEFGVGAGADMTGEARWLSNVSRAYATSPVVARTVRMMKCRSAAQRRTAAQPRSWVDDQLQTLGYKRPLARGVAAVKR